ncbi:MAG: tyrosine-type recombinase/integrase [Myxococcales bacterium]|nr:tyrosine-type recombinase/integrase [Myxococcales bacterium]
MWPKRHQAEEDLRPYWNPDEEITAFRTLDRWRENEPAFAYAMIVQMLFGLRFGELRALEKRDLDLKIPGLWVKRSMARKKTHAPKNGKARFHQLPVALAEELDEYSRTTSGNLLFPSPTGNRLDNAVLNRAYARLALEAGVPRITSHGARHTCASSSAAHGLSQAQIARYIGHSDVATTSRYTHVADSGMRSLVDARWRHLKSDS